MHDRTWINLKFWELLADKRHNTHAILYWRAEVLIPYYTSRQCQQSQCTIFTLLQPCSLTEVHPNLLEEDLSSCSEGLCCLCQIMKLHGDHLWDWKDNHHMTTGRAMIESLLSLQTSNYAWGFMELGDILSRRKWLPCIIFWHKSTQ